MVAQFLNVFCRTTKPISRNELVEQISEFWYDDNPLIFSPDPTEPTSKEAEWRRLAINFPDRKRPATIHLENEREAVSEMSNETIGELHTRIPGEIFNTLREAREVYSIEIYPDDLGEDEWEFLDLLQSFFARRCDGIVVTDDGVYDKELNQLVER